MKTKVAGTKQNLMWLFVLVKKMVLGGRRTRNGKNKLKKRIRKSK